MTVTVNHMPRRADSESSGLARVALGKKSCKFTSFLMQAHESTINYINEASDAEINAADLGGD